MRAPGETAVTDVGQETSGSDPRARGRAYVGFAPRPPRLYRLMFGGTIERFASHPELDGASQAAFGFLRADLGDDADTLRRVDRLPRRFEAGKR